MLHFFSAADTYLQNSWSLWSYCFIYPPMFIFHSWEALTCLPWMTACIEFSQVVLRILTTWQRISVVVIFWINTLNYFTVMGRDPPLSVNCIRRVTQVQAEMSQISVTFQSIWGISLFSACVFFGSLILRSVWTYEGPGGEQQKDQLVWLQETQLPSQQLRSKMWTILHVCDKTGGKLRQQRLGQRTSDFQCHSSLSASPDHEKKHREESWILYQNTSMTRLTIIGHCCHFKHKFRFSFICYFQSRSKR